MIATSSVSIVNVNDGATGATGPQGISVTKVVEEYRLSNSSTELTGSGTGYTWSETKPDIPSGKYLWIRERTDLSNNTSSYGTAHCDIVISGLVYDVNQNTQSITSKVWQSDITNSINTYDGSTGAAIRDRVTQTETNISGITSRVSDVESETDSLGTRMTSAESSITQNANNIALKVSQDGVISAINQSAESILISASKVDIQGAVSFSSLDSTLQGRITGVESTASTANTTANTANATANTALKGMKVYSGTCSTAAGTAAKVVSCSDADFEMTNGVIITVTFSKANTTASPTLNVASKGAKAIYFNGAQASSTNVFRWQAGSVITFQYDGTNWNVLNFQNLDYFTCSTAAGTTAKATNSVTGTFVLCKGTTITVFFGTSNSVNAPTLNVGSTGAYAIYYKNAVTSASNQYLWSANTTVGFTFNGSYWYVNDGGAQLAKDYAETAVDWVGTNGTTVVTAADIMKTWVDDATLATTTIDGGYIKTHTIEAEHLATDAIMSSNYDEIENSHFSSSGSFFDLSNGNIYTPNFGVSAASGSTGAYINGEIVATSGTIGSNSTNYWEIGNKYDYNATERGAIIGHGASYIQAGNWQLSNDKLNTQSYVTTQSQSGVLQYYKDADTNTFYDVGLKIPTSFATGATDSNAERYHRAFFYQRSYTGSTAPAQDSGWNYPFIVDNEGRVYCTDLIIVGGGTGTTYLPLAGGTITGALTVNGKFTAGGEVSTTLQIQTNLGSTSAATFTGAASAIVKPGVTGKLGVGNGGTGKNSWTANGIVYASASNALSQLGVGTSGQVLKSNGNAAPGWVNQSTIAAGSATNDSDGNAINTTYRKISNNTFDTINVTDLTAGSLIVNGVGRFVNGLYGNLTGTATNVSNSLKIQLNGGTTEGTNQFTFNGSAVKNINITKSSVGLGNVDNTADADKTVKEAGKVTKTLKIQLNGGTTEDTNQFSYNGSAVKNINITKSSIGLGNVENTALSTWAGSANLTTTKVGTLAAAAAKGVDTSISASSTSANLPTSAAVATFVEGKGYVTSSGVTSVRVQATSPVVSSVNTAQSSTLNTTISLADAYGDTKNPYGTKTANYVLAGPSSGNAAAPSFRKLVEADIPTLATSKVGLGNVTNNKQVKGLSSGTTSGHIVTWGSDGYTVTDGGIAKGSLATKVTLAGTDYSASSNAITITQANLQSAVQSTSLVLMTSSERSKLASIQVAEGGTIDFSGVTASSPLTATVGADKTVNITHDTSNVSAGTYRSVTVNTYGHVTAGTNPTTLSGYGITDAKIANGVITLGSNTITPLTASSTLNAAKLSGTASISTTGNAGTANALVLSADVGSATKPVYFKSDGKPYEITSLASLNGTATAYPEFYAPTGAGTSGQYLKSSGTGAPTWATFSKSTVGLGNVDNTADSAKRVKGANITTTANAVAYYTDTSGTFGTKASANGALYATSANGALNWGTLPIAQGGTGGTTALAATANIGAPYIQACGTLIDNNSNIDTIANTVGTYYISSSTNSQTLTGTVPITYSGFKMITYGGYRTATLRQFVGGSTNDLFYRSSQDTGTTWTKWYKFVLLPSGDDKKTFSNVGSATQPVYVQSNGSIVACTSYANASVNYATSAGSATNITPTQLTTEDLNDINTLTHTKYYYAGGHNNVKHNPANSSEPPDTDSGVQFGMVAYKTAAGHVTQELASYGNSVSKWMRACVNSSWSAWQKFITSANYTDYAVAKTGGTFTGEVTGTSFGASSYLAANTDNLGAAGGLALYATNPTNYGIAMRKVSNGGAHGFVQGDWGTYFYMGGASSNYQTRGWVWKSVYNSTNIASISCEGHAVFNGSVTVGGNAANTSGCKMVFNTTTQSLDFVFN